MVYFQRYKCVCTASITWSNKYYLSFMIRVHQHRTKPSPIRYMKYYFYFYYFIYSQYETKTY